MITCKECAQKFKLNVLKRKVKCPHCDSIIGFDKTKRGNRVRSILRALHIVVHWAIFIGIMLLYSWMIDSCFTLPQRLFIGLSLLAIFTAMEKFVFGPMIRRMIMKMYHNHDKKT